jgi:hypothetical protein
MINVDIVRQRAVKLFVGSPGLMTKRLIMELLRGALVITVLLGIVTLVNHEEPPAIAASAVPTPKADRAPSLNKPVKVEVIKEAAPPPDVVATRDESEQPVIVQPTLITKPVEPVGDGDAAPVREKRQFKLEVKPFNAKLRRYCARPGKTERSWLRVRGVKHYCRS